MAIITVTSNEASERLGVSKDFALKAKQCDCPGCQNVAEEFRAWEVDRKQMKVASDKPTARISVLEWYEVTVN